MHATIAIWLFGWLAAASWAAPAQPATRPAPGPLGGQIVADPDRPAGLIRHGGGPVYLCGPGDPEGFLYRGRRNADGTREGDQMKLIAKLKAHGGNCIYVQAWRGPGGDGDRTQNPFVDADPTKGLSKAVLDQWETWFAEMDKAGIVIFLFLYDDGAVPRNVPAFRTGDAVGPAERKYLHGLVDRFKHHRNLIWCIKEEYRESLSRRRASRIAAAIRAADEHGHVIANHQNNGVRFDHPDDPCIDQFAIQYNAATAEKLHAGVLAAWKQSRGRYGLNLAEAAGHMTDLRRKNWAIGMAGAHAMVIGMDIAGTAPADLAACRIQQRFFESTDFHTMTPHDELAAGATRYVLADAPRSCIAYTDRAGGAVGVRKLPAGRYDLTWVDCATGATKRQDGVTVAAGDGSFPRPPGIGAECAVWIRRATGRE